MAAQFFRLDGIEIKALSIYERSKVSQPAAQGLCKIWVSSHGFVFEPEAFELEGTSFAVKAGIEARHQVITIKDWQGVITPAPQFERLVDFPNIVESKKLFRASAGTDDFERSQKSDFVVCIRAKGRPSGRCLAGFKGFEPTRWMSARDWLQPGHSGIVQNSTSTRCLPFW